MKNTSRSMIILILFLVQFIDVLDFMVVMPLGPDFAKSLNIPESMLGYLAGSYTFAAAITGFFSSTYIDRFERKKVLLFTLVGLIIANLLSANAWNFASILASRFLAGAFGGPATSVCFAIVADLFDNQSRGAVMGKVMGGFSLAAVFGVPIGLELSQRFGWYASFYFVALIGVITLALLIIFMPQIANTTAKQNNKITYKILLNRPANSLALFATFIGSMASFMIIPYVSAFVQLNLHYPRNEINYIYFIGGAYSFFAMRFAGKLVDRTSSSFTTTIANIFIVVSLLFGFLILTQHNHVLLIFPLFMLGMGVRNVSSYTLYSKVPAINERAGFMSLQSCVQHIASSIGAFTASAILINNSGEPLQNMSIVVIIAMLLFLVAPPLLKNIEHKISND